MREVIMREFSISFFIDIVNNILPFLILDKYCTTLLSHKYSDNRHTNRLYYFLPIQVLLSASYINATFLTVCLFLSYFAYVLLFYTASPKKCMIFVCKFFMLYYGLLAILYFIISLIIDFIPNSAALLNNHFYIYLKGVLFSSIIYIFSSFYLSRKKLGKHTIDNPYKRSIYFIMGLILIVMGSFIIFIYTFNSSKNTMEDIVTLIFLINILMIVIILSIYEKIVDSLQETALKQLQQQKYELAQGYYEELAVKSKQLVSLRHDFKNHLGVIAGRLEQNNYSEALAYLEKITAATKSAGDLVVTNNPTISAILQSKKAECKKKGITFTYTAAFEKIYKLTDMDFTIILGNILDNAIEALGSEITDKYLTVSIAQVSTYLVIQCENPFSAKPLKKNGYLVTSKKDKEIHGIGLFNISEVCEKYGGEFHYSYDNCIFTVKILLPNY